MIIPAFWSGDWIAAGVNHVWQSTVVVGLAWALTLALQKNQARVRYWVWMIASVKFLLPFSLLTQAGAWLRSLLAMPVAAKPALARVMEQIAQPFPQTQFIDAAENPVAAHSINWAPALLAAVWICGALIVALRAMRGRARIRAVMRAARPLAFVSDVPVLSSMTLIEPGIFGIFRPVLLLPEGIVERLALKQLQAIVAHEMHHVRRRDNLTFAIHMIVQVVFWFHPAVWWTGSRLVEERERACDEAVLEAGSAAEDYAEGILNVCRFYVESPLECVAGVTGAELKSRIARILTMRGARKLTLSRKLLLGAAGLLAIAVPLAFGLVNALQGSAHASEEPPLSAFDVVSIKPHKDEGMRMQAGIWIRPDGISASGIPLPMILREAFGVSEDRLLNEPDWAKSSRYDIEAKVAPEDAAKLKALSPQQRWEMLLPALEDRFGLKFHRDMADLQAYTLVVAKGGEKMTAAQPPSAGGDAFQGPVKADGSGGSAPQSQMMMRRSSEGMRLECHAASLASLVQTISEQLGSTVVDKTGLTGNYDFTLSWMPDEGSGPMMEGSAPMMMRMSGVGGPADGDTAKEASGPSLFTALQEQLGLKLERQKVHVDVVVIDRLGQLSPN